MSQGSTVSLSRVLRWLKTVARPLLSFDHVHSDATSIFRYVDLRALDKSELHEDQSSGPDYCSTIRDEL